MSLFKAAIKYTNLQETNENLEKDINKMKSVCQTPEMFSSSSISHNSQPQQQLIHTNKPIAQSEPSSNEMAQELKTILKEMKLLVFTCNNHGYEKNTRNLTDSVDDKFLHDGKVHGFLKNHIFCFKYYPCSDSNLVSNGSPNEIYSRLESKLNHLNQIGLGLKKENYG